MNERTPPETPDDAEDDPIYEQAALWVARLSSPDATDADRKACEAWRLADPAHAEAFSEMDAWRRTMGQVPDPRRGRGRTLKGLAVAAILGGGGLLAYQMGMLDRLRADAWTEVGAIEARTLTDGSRVDLNTDTALALYYTAEERRIELLRGEAAFDVVPDRRRPFIVRGRGISVRAVGTRFFVRVDGAANPVGVAEGQVEVTASDGRGMVRAGEVAAHGAAGRLVAEPSDVARAMAWRDGRLVFSGHPLAAVLSELERYRSGRIVLIGQGAAAKRFSGTLDPRDTDEALAVLAATMGVRITRVTPLLVLVHSAS